MVFCRRRARLRRYVVLVARVPTAGSLSRKKSQSPAPMAVFSSMHKSKTVDTAKRVPRLKKVKLKVVNKAPRLKQAKVVTRLVRKTLTQTRRCRSRSHIKVPL